MLGSWGGAVDRDDRSLSLPRPLPSQPLPCAAFRDGEEQRGKRRLGFDLAVPLAKKRARPEAECPWSQVYALLPWLQLCECHPCPSASPRPPWKLSPLGLCLLMLPSLTLGPF